MSTYRAEINIAAAKHRLDPDLVEAVVITESSGKTSAYRFEPAFWLHYMANKPEWKGANPERVSSSYGLMQVMYQVALELGYKEAAPEYLFIPEVGLNWGCAKLRSLLDWSKDNVEQALAAYNGGKGGNSTPPYRNEKYVKKVLINLYAIKEERRKDESS